jgi:predicted nucleic acid-binding protein
MKGEVLWDSGVFLALLDVDDANHERAVTVAKKLGSEQRISIITNYVEVETHALLLRRLGRAAALQWLTSAEMDVARATPEDELRAKEILVRHPDKDWSLCDAISFSVAERRGIRTAFSFDRHFRQYGRFEILGLPR